MRETFHDIIHWYYRNKQTIWKIIVGFVITIVVIQFGQKIWIKTQENKNTNTIVSETNDEKALNSITLSENKSTLTGEDISKEQSNWLKVLDEFIEYCNNAKINEAYNLLSEDCRNAMYPTVDKFKENYYNKLFIGTKRNISVENWINNIYKVKFIEDPLSTGKYNEETNIQDYITVIKDKDGNAKLNINNYIERKEINKEKEVNNLNIKVLEKNRYMDFETYTFEITNNSDKIILLNDSNNLNTMYLQDQNNLKYSAYMHELSEAELTLYPGETREITIKYYNRYSSSKQINKIVFSEVVLNYRAYTNATNYNNYGTIQIDL